MAATLPAAGVEGEAPPEAQPGTLAVVMNFEEDFAPPVLVQMQQEVEDILEPVRLGLRWRFAKDHRWESSTYLVTVNLKGRCAALEDAGSQRTSRPLGSTDIVDGHLIPYCELNCDRVRSFIGPEMSRAAPGRSERLLGRALGRVLAHELYHILAGTVRHGKTAVTQSRVTPEGLVRGELNLEPSDVAEIYAKRPGTASALVARPRQ